MVTALPDHAKALAAGVDRVLVKPFTAAGLVEAVKQLAGAERPT
jgi:CheY-like chemotaxis protein